MGIGYCYFWRVEVGFELCVLSVVRISRCLCTGLRLCLCMSSVTSVLWYDCSI